MISEFRLCELVKYLLFAHILEFKLHRNISNINLTEFLILCETHERN